MNRATVFDFFGAKALTIGVQYCVVVLCDITQVKTLTIAAQPHRG